MKLLNRPSRHRKHNRVTRLAVAVLSFFSARRPRNASEWLCNIRLDEEWHGPTRKLTEREFEEQLQKLLSYANCLFHKYEETGDRDCIIAWEVVLTAIEAVALKLRKMAV